MPPLQRSCSISSGGSFCAYQHPRLDGPKALKVPTKIRRRGIFLEPPGRSRHLMAHFRTAKLSERKSYVQTDECSAVTAVLFGLATAVSRIQQRSQQTRKSPISPTRLASSTSKLQSRPCKKRRTRKSSPLPSRWWAIYCGEQSSARTGQKAQRHAGGAIDPQPNPDQAGRRHAQERLPPSTERLSTRLTSIARCRLSQDCQHRAQWYTHSRCPKFGVEGTAAERTDLVRGASEARAEQFAGQLH